MRHYGFNVAWSEGDGAYIATCPDFPGLSAFGPTPDRAIAEMETALSLAIETYRAEGWKLPVPTCHRTHSGQFRVRLPKDLHSRLAARATEEGVSLNTLVVAYLAEAVAPHDFSR